MCKRKSALNQRWPRSLLGMWIASSIPQSFKEVVDCSRRHEPECLPIVNCPHHGCRTFDVSFRRCSGCAGGFAPAQFVGGLMSACATSSPKYCPPRISVLHRSIMSEAAHDDEHTVVERATWAVVVVLANIIATVPPGHPSQTIVGNIVQPPRNLSADRTPASGNARSHGHRHCVSWLKIRV